MAINKKLEDLNPELQKRLKKVFWEFDKKSIKYAVVETKRSTQTQEAYYAQGRKTLEQVNHLRKQVGLWLITDAENKKTITQTLKSRHLSGNAIDLCPVKDGKLWWNAPEQVWTEMGIIAEKYGVDWCAGGYGQTWGKGWDNPHFELMENWND
ncbi:MAG: M15 family metallopeptidase [Treponemataceae bacterium]